MSLDMVMAVVGIVEGLVVTMIVKKTRFCPKKKNGTMLNN